MTVLLVCGLLLFSPAEGPAATLPPTETSDFLDAIDLSAWDDFFSCLEETEPWQRPSELVRAFAEGEDDPAQLIAWLKARGRAGLTGAASLLLLALVTGVLAALFETLLDTPSVPARRVLSVGLAALLLTRLLPIIQQGLACLRGILALAEVTVPLMTGALLLLGSPQGAALMGTLGELLVGICLRWVEGGLALLALSAGVLRAADLTGDGVLTSFSKLLFTVSRWGVRIISAGYSILAALMGAGAAGMDSLLLRTGRMAAGSLPLVGSLVSDSLGATAVCLSLVKGALGRTGMLLILCENPCTSLPIPKTKEGFVSRKRASGVGMGIPIIKEIVDEAAGIIQMDQTDGHFIVLISLPADEENLIDAAPNPYAEFY